MIRCGSCLIALMFAGSVLAQEATPAKKPKAPAAGRLPAHYGDLVTPDQKAKIYAVQAKWKDKLDPLTEQVKKIQADRDAEIEAILTPEQKEKLAKTKADATAKRAAASEAAKKAAEAAKVTAPAKAADTAIPKPVAPTTTTVKPATVAPATK